jgi:predicted ATPase/DNA-binding SARP family transcriptional activator
MEIRLLGRFDVLVDGVALALGGHRQRAVLAVLALHANEVVSIDRLVEEVWGGESPETAVPTLRRYISHLRYALEEQPASIDTRRPGYALTVDLECIDARRFEWLVEEGRQHLSFGAVDDAAAVLRSALSLWHGEPLADFAYESFARIEATRLEELRLSALELRVDTDLALGRHAKVVSELEALVAMHPLRESYRGQLMRALHRTGRRADALRVYSSGRHVLADELGLDPSTGLQQLEQAILVDDPAAEAPSPRLHTRAPGRLPAEVTSFIGRSNEVQAVAELLGRSRLVTLAGVGGSGKSRLALRVAATIGPSLPGGAWLVELGPVVDSAVVARMVADALGVRDEPERETVDLLVETVRHERCLVVLDSCERLLDAIAPLVERLLAETTGVRVLATSREVLDIHAEAVFRVPTLAVPGPDADQTLEAITGYDSVKLFIERASAADAAFQPGDHDVPAIAEVCRRLEGLPLALELAAAQTDMLTLRQVADRLDNRFALLTRGRRTAPPRHRTLRAAIEWSYDLLGESERLLFDRLSVFAGSFTVEVAEAVCSGGGLDRADVFDILGHLLRKSLVVRVATTGPVAEYRLLDTLRDYGLERLRDRADGVRAHQRHAQFFIELAEHAGPGLRTSGAVRVYEELEAAHGEFRAALSWLLDHQHVEMSSRLAAALVPFWDYRTLIRDGRLWLERVLDMARHIEAPPSPHRLLATIGAAYCAFQVDDFPAAFTYADEASAMLDVIPDDVAEAKLLTTRAELARSRNDLALAERFAVRAAELCRGAGEHAAEANALRALSVVYLDRGDLDKTMATATVCLRASQTCGDLERIAGAQSLLGTILKDRGRLSEAAELFEECLGHFQQLGEPWGMGVMFWHLSGIATMQGHYDDATRFAEESLRMFEAIGIPRGVGEAHLLLADAELGRGNVELAEQWCASAMARFRQRGFAGDLILGLATEARIRLAAGDLAGAVCSCDEGLGHARARGSRRDIGRLLCFRASLYVRQGSLAEAAGLVEEAMATFDSMGAADGRGTASALAVLADIAVAQGRPRDARAHLSTAEAALSAADAVLTKAEVDELERIRAAAAGAVTIEAAI